MRIAISNVPQEAAPRGLHALLTRFFDWKHLVLVGVTACLALSLLCYLYIAASRALVAFALFPLSLLLFGLMLYQEKLLRYPDIKILFAAFIWLNVVCLLNVNRVSAADIVEYYTTACSVALLCYPLAYLIAENRRMKALDLLCWVWITPVACSSIFAICLVMSGTTLYRQSDMAIAGLNQGRLCLICDANMYALLCCIAICLILYLLLGRRRPLSRALLIFFALCLFFALTLTDSRGSMYSLLLACFFFAAIPICRLMYRQKTLLRLLMGVAAGLVFCAILLVGTRGIKLAANRVAAAVAQAKVETVPDAVPSEATPAVQSEAAPAVQSEAAPMPTSALSEAAPAVQSEVAPVPTPALSEAAPAVQSEVAPVPTPTRDTFVSRDAGYADPIRDRVNIITYALKRLSEEKDVFLRGATPALSRSMFLDPTGLYSYNHFHNAYLAVLLNYGLPGFLLLLLFLVYLAVCFCRVVFSPRRDMPPAVRFLPVILLPILAVSFIEEMLFTRNFVSELDVWLAIVGGYTAVLSRIWHVKKSDRATDPEKPSIS